MDLKSAERLARQQVKDLWPELASIQPIVAPRRRRAPVPAGIGSLAVCPEARPGAEADEITFTFAGEMRTPDGDALLRVARVTVRDGGVVRTTISR